MMEEVIVTGHIWDAGYSGGGGTGNGEGGFNDHPQLTPGGGGGSGSPVSIEPITVNCTTKNAAAKKVGEKLYGAPTGNSVEWPPLLPRSQTETLEPAAIELLPTIVQDAALYTLCQPTWQLLTDLFIVTRDRELGRTLA